MRITLFGIDFWIFMVNKRKVAKGIWFRERVIQDEIKDDLENKLPVDYHLYKGKE